VELISFTCQITESIPPIPAIAIALLFGVGLPLLNRLGLQIGLTKQEQAVIFMLVAIGSVMSSVGVTQAFLPYTTVPEYFGLPENNLHEMRDALPNWIGPRDSEVVRAFYEGSDAGVPWKPWLKPLGLWFLFFLAYWLTTLCLWVLFRKQWSDTERLGFPLLYIPVHLSEGLDPKEEERPFLKDPLMWTGFGIAFTYNLLNILNAFNPSVAALGVYYPVGQLFTERPLNALAGLQMWHRPELIGLGYLMAQDVLQSVWSLYLLENLLAVAGNTLGWLSAGFPYIGEQGLGGSFAMGLFLLWSAREHLKRVALKAFGKEDSIDDREEPIPYRWAFFGFLGGFASLVLFTSLVGVHPLVSFLFILILLLSVFVYARIRAETGTPSVWALSHSLLKDLPFYLLGSNALKIGGSIRTMTGLTHFFFLCHGGFFNQSTVYQMESFRLSDEVQGNRKEMVWVGLISLVVGLTLAYWMFMTTYYQYGANVLAGGARSGTGGVRIDYCLQAFRQVDQYIDHPRAIDKSRDAALGIGAAVTALLIAARIVYLRFPLHPLGFIMACIVGSQLWWAFFVAWAIKKTVLHIGGVRLYKRLIPAFLGLALGHFFTAGILWGSIKSLWPYVELVVWFT